MTRAKIRIILLVLVVAILLVLAALFAFPKTGQAPTAADHQGAPAGVPPTKVVTYVPPAPATSTPVEQGSCWTNSIAAPFRADAWRCSVGNSISDPCFNIPGSNDLLCNMDPAIPDATSSFVLKLTSPLPKPQAAQGSAPSDWAWLLELADGTRCAPFTGTMPIAEGGISASYGCAPKTPGGEGLLIFNLNENSSTWTADVGQIVANSSSMPVAVEQGTIPVATVWQ